VYSNEKLTTVEMQAFPPASSLLPFVNGAGMIFSEPDHLDDSLAAGKTMLGIITKGSLRLPPAG